MFSFKSLIGGIFLSFFFLFSMSDVSVLEAENQEQEDKSIAVDINIIPGDEQEIATTDEGKTIRVALMGSEDIDVSKIDHHTVRLQGAKHNGNLVIVDKNNDGFNDFLVEFSAKRLNLKEGANELTFNGMTKDGKSFKGSSTYTVPAAK